MLIVSVLLGQPTRCMHTSQCPERVCRSMALGGDELMFNTLLSQSHAHKCFAQLRNQY